MSTSCIELITKGNIYEDKFKTHGVHLLYFRFGTFYVKQACKILLYCKSNLYFKNDEGNKFCLDLIF